MEGKERSDGKSFIEKCKPYFAMVCLQFGYAGMNLVTKVSLNNGMSHFVLVVYSLAFATTAIAPFALVLERNERPKMTFPIFMQIFVLGLLGPVMHQNLYYVGLKLTSPTFSCTMSSMLPAMTFIIAILCRMEKVELKKLRCQVKVVGTLVMVLGAMLMILYKSDHVINMTWSSHFRHATTTTSSLDMDWFKGSIHLILATLSWAVFFILLSITMRRYTAKLSLIALICFLGTLQSTALTLIMEHNPSVWTIGWDMNLLAAAYAGIITLGIAYYVQGLVVEKRGTVFVTAFKPLTTIIVAFMGTFIFAYKVHIESVIGAILILMGLYWVLWGKYKEEKEENNKEDISEKITKITNSHHHLATIIEEIESNDIESQSSKIKVITVQFVHPPFDSHGKS